MRHLIYAILLVFVVAMSAACGGDVCERAADVAEDECGLEPLEDTGDDEDEVECEGETEELATCIIDNSSAFCEFIDDPVNNNDNAYTQCVSDVTGG